MNKKPIYLLKILLSTLLISISCLFQACENKNHNDKVLILGTSLDYPPFESSHNGEAIGFDIDVAKALANEMGYTLEVKDLDFSGLIPALKSGMVDFVMAGMSQSEERKKNIDFTTPYYEDEKNVLLHLNDKQFKSINEIANKKIGTQQGSVQEVALKELKESIPSIEIVALTKNPNLIQEVKIGRIHAILISETQAKKFAEANPQLTYSKIESIQPGIAIALKKDSPLTTQFNEVLKTLEAKGTLQELKTKWFN